MATATVAIEQVTKKRGERGKGRLWQIGKIWWIQYYLHGQQIRESSNSEKKVVAEELLTQRLTEKKLGLLRTANAEKLRYEKMRDALYARYRNEGSRSLKHAKPEPGEDVGREYVCGVWPHLDNFFAGYRASEITTKTMREFIDKRLAESASKGCINGSLALLRAMIYDAFRDGLIRRDDIPYFPMFPKSPRRDIRLNPAQFERLHQQLPDYLKAPTRLAYYNGLRCEEVFGLKWEEVDWEAGVIELPADRTKTGEQRMIPMEGKVLTDLRTLFVNRGPGAELIFQKNGRHIGDFRKVWRSALRRAELPEKFVFHGLRYCGASNPNSAGVSQVTAMDVTGHKTDAMFRAYNLSNVSDIKKAGRSTAAHIENGASSGQTQQKVASSESLPSQLPN